MGVASAAGAELAPAAFAGGAALPTLLDAAAGAPLAGFALDGVGAGAFETCATGARSEEHTSELQSQ